MGTPSNAPRPSVRAALATIIVVQYIVRRIGMARPSADQLDKESEEEVADAVHRAACPTLAQAPALPSADTMLGRPRMRRTIWTTMAVSISMVCLPSLSLGHRY
jgi:hypothetical protein